MLAVDKLSVAYGQAVVLHGVSLTVGDGEAIAVLGANGAGKSTLIKALVGWIRPLSGRIELNGEDITFLPPWERATRGLAVVPEGRRIFPDLSVEENLRLGAYLESDPRTFSGGEQQMLAIGRAVVRKPSLLLVDEASMGLSPIVVEMVFRALGELHREGVSLLLVEQNAHEALKIVERGYVMENGRIVLEGSAEELRRNPKVQAAYLGGV